MKHPRGEVSAMGTLILLLVFLFVLGVLWFASGGPERSSGLGPFLAPPWVLNAGDSYTLPGIAIPGQEQPSGGGATQDVQQEVRPSFFDLFFGFRGTTEVRDSPYAGQVRLSLGNVATSDPDDEYIIIRTASDLPKSITISGWTLQGDANALNLKIGQAVELSFLGQVNAEIPITLPANSTVYVTTGRSPNGTSFRANLCTGYFEQFQNFSPSLRLDCPSPETEALKRLEIFSGNAACVDFIGRIPSCTLITTNLPVEIGGLCRSFIVDELTYNGCTAAHKNEPGFYANEWRIFLKREQEIWRNTYERIRLLDENGKTIDVIGY